MIAEVPLVPSLFLHCCCMHCCLCMTASVAAGEAPTNVASTVPTYLKGEMVLQSGFQGIVAVNQLLKCNIATLRHWMNVSILHGVTDHPRRMRDPCNLQFACHAVSSSPIAEWCRCPASWQILVVPDVLSWTPRATCILCPGPRILHSPGSHQASVPSQCQLVSLTHLTEMTLRF